MTKQIKKQKVTLVRVYTDDSHDHINKTLEQLHDRGDVIGMTIFRGVAGFGEQGHIHETRLLELCSKLPVVIEFYHKSEKSDELIDFIHERIKGAHIVSWEVDLSFEHIT